MRGGGGGDQKDARSLSAVWSRGNGIHWKPHTKLSFTSD